MEDAGGGLMEDPVAVVLLSLLADYAIEFGKDSPPNEITVQELAGDLIDSLPIEEVYRLETKLQEAFGYEPPKRSASWG